MSKQPTKKPPVKNVPTTNIKKKSETNSKLNSKQSIKETIKEVKNNEKSEEIKKNENTEEVKNKEKPEEELKNIKAEEIHQSEPNLNELEQDIQSQAKKKTEDLDYIVKNIVLTEKDEQFLETISQKLEKLDAKIVSLKCTVGDSEEKIKINNKQQKMNENLEKMIQRVRENDVENKPLDKNKDVKQSIENTIIEVFSHNQKLEELLQDMKKGFHLKNQQIFNLQEELLKYTTLCKDQEKQIEYLENRLSGKEKLLNQYQEDPKKKLAEINEKLRGVNIETSVKKQSYKENFENPHNADPYDVWKTNDDETLPIKPSQKLEDILGNKNNLWILKHESDLNQVVSKNYK